MPTAAIGKRARSNMRVKCVRWVRRGQRGGHTWTYVRQRQKLKKASGDLGLGPFREKRGNTRHLVSTEGEKKRRIGGKSCQFWLKRGPKWRKTERCRSGRIKKSKR